jgi:uncharacterized protein (TIGR03032 family)
VSEEKADSNNEQHNKTKETPNFGSVYTEHVPEILKQLGVSLLISTYQAGKLIIVRPDKSGGVNTHFVNLLKPMRIATSGMRFAVGTRHEIIEYKNVPAAAAKVEPKNTHDACFVPWLRHTTGDIDIHEMAYDKNDKLWFINTKFSCLCTRHDDYSFHPEWRPWFISGYAPEDRCHINGLAMLNGKPKYVSSLGVGDGREIWREKKASGGTIMDIDQNEFVFEGLSMPHSPRIYQDKLWVLESGRGSLACIDLKSGKLETVCELDGFTRGIDFIGDLAFIGLSQIRESNTFGSLPITERLKERICGVWMVNIKTGKVLGFLKFNGSVQEIFSVQAIRGSLFPAVLDADDALVNSTYVLSDEALKDVDFASINKAKAEAEKQFQETREKKTQEEKTAQGHCLQ